MGGGGGGAAPGRSARRLLASQPLWQRSEKRGKKQRGSHQRTPDSVPETRGSCPTIPAQDGSTGHPGSELGFVTRVLAELHSRSPLLPVHPLLRSGRSFQRREAAPGAVRVSGRGTDTSPECGHAAWHSLSADLLGTPAIPRAAIVFCSLFISPGWCHRWAIVPADSLKGEGTRLNFLLFN